MSRRPQDLSIVFSGVRGAIVDAFAVPRFSILGNDLLAFFGFDVVDELTRYLGARRLPLRLRERVVSIDENLSPLNKMPSFGTFFFSATQVLLSVMK